MPSPIPKPPYGPEFEAFLAALPGPADITMDILKPLRDAQEAAATLETVLEGMPFTHGERTAPGPNGPVKLSIFHPKGGAAPRTGRPAIFYAHSGGMICGTRFTGLREVLGWARETGAVCITVEYRLSPEHPFPAPLEDGFAGLKWVGDNLGGLGIDPKRLLLAGQSAGGNMVAGLTMMMRDRGGPGLCGQLLDSPMLDDRMETNASRQFVGEGSWSRGSNVTAWTAYLGDKAGKPGVSPYAAPSRATNLSGLPPAMICAGSAEVFRDESVAYAQKLWESGVQAELHIWPGGFHLFDTLVPNHPVSRSSLEAKEAWVKRALTQNVDPKL